MKPLTLLAAIAICAIVEVGVGLHADDTSTLPDGLALTINGEKVELRVAFPDAFRLHVFTPPDTEGASVYLSDARRGQLMPIPTVIHDGSAVGIQTSFGALLVDPPKGTWTLRDGSGATLTDWAPLGHPATMAGQPAAFTISVGAAPKVPHSFYYGSGNLPMAGALVQTKGESRTANGRAGLPQYWSTAGYGALMVGQADSAPGTWTPAADGSVNWNVPGNGVDLYLMPAPTLYDWLRADANLTGFAPVPPRWSFGYLQSRWGWKDKAYIDDTLAHFRQDQLPVDAFIFDFEWYTKKPDYKVPSEGQPDYVDFDWNATLFPDPAKQIAGYAAQGLHVIGIRKPRLGNTDNLAMARGKGWVPPVVAPAPHQDATATRNLDYSQADVRKYWAENNRKFLDAGMAGFWNDEGEKYYTEYTYWNTAEVDLQRQVDPQARFWSINRSFIPGMQRLGAAVWTGDIHADWKTLARTPGELLSYGLSGMPYSACDIGGFSGETNPELLTRWMEAGVFFPVMRCHSEISVTPHFPWLFGPDGEAAIRTALDLRYRLLPYYYSLAHETYSTGAPLMRPLVMEFPNDAQVANLTDEWLMGGGLLAAPILSEGGARTVYLPNDKWYAFGTTQATQGPQTINVTAKLDEIPMYVRAGTLLPLGPVVQYTSQASDAPLELQIYPGRDATFTLVEDDGKTLGYQSGAVRTTMFSWNDHAQTLSWKITGTYQGANSFHALKAVLFSPSQRAEKPAPLDQDGSLSFK